MAIKLACTLPKRPSNTFKNLAVCVSDDTLENILTLLLIKTLPPLLLGNSPENLPLLLDSGNVLSDVSISTIFTVTLPIELE